MLTVQIVQFRILVAALAALAAPVFGLPTAQEETTVVVSTVTEPSAPEPAIWAGVLPAAVRNALLHGDSDKAIDLLGLEEAVVAATIKERSELQKRADPYVWNLYCADKDYQGVCMYGMITSQYIMSCYYVGDSLNDKITSYMVGGGCCAFYRHAGCGERLFTALSRSDGQLGGSWLISIQSSQRPAGVSES